MRNPWIPRVIVFFVLAAAWIPASRAQQPAPAEEAQGALLAEIAGLHRSLDQLVELLRAGLAHQKIDVMLKRIELKERRLAPLERRLRGTQDSILNSQGEIARLEQMKESTEQELADLIREGHEGAINESRYLMGEFEKAIRSEQATIEELERRVVELEDELADGRDEIAILDEKLAELLEE